MRRPMLVLLAVSALAVCSLVPPAWAGPPTDQMRRYTDEVVRILKDPGMKTDARRAAVKKIAEQVFDLSETARRALGRHWQQLTPQQRQEFVPLFEDLLERTYMSKIDLYGGEKVRYTNETVDGDNASVKASVITKKGTEVPVEARLLNRDGKWLIYDVLVENISLVGNYRAQFDQIIRTSSYDELVRRLRDKQAGPDTMKRASH